MAKLDIASKKYGDRGAKLYCLQDTAAAVQNILLAATAFGLGTCWVGAFEDNEVRRILGLSNELKPVVIIPVGFFEEGDRTPSRYSLDEVVTVIE